MGLSREIPGFDGKFILHITGVSIICWNTNWRGTGKTKQVTDHISKNGYVIWNLNHNIKQVAYWVAITFPELIENEYFEGAEIDHKDTNRQNNMPGNLHWVTHKDNLRNPLTVKKIAINQTGENNSNYGSKAQHNRKDQSKPVNQYTLKGDFVAWYPSAMEAERQLNVKKLNTRISENCKGKRKTASGYVWRYA